jgi:hypothetical protein
MNLSRHTLGTLMAPAKPTLRTDCLVALGVRVQQLYVVSCSEL